MEHDLAETPGEAGGGSDISFPNGEGVVKSKQCPGWACQRRSVPEIEILWGGEGEGGTRVSTMTRRLPFPVMGQSDLGVSPTSLTLPLPRTCLAELSLLRFSERHCDCALSVYLHELVRFVSIPFPGFSPSIVRL